MSRFIFATAAIAVAILAPAVSHGQSQSSSDGQFIFGFDTFGDEQPWTDTLRMQDAIRNVSPRTALSVGLKVDSDALPPALINALRAGQVNLDDPAVTIQLLKIKAGVVTKGGRPSTPGSMRSVISTSRGASTGWWMAGSKSR